MIENGILVTIDGGEPFVSRGLSGNEYIMSKYIVHRLETPKAIFLSINSDELDTNYYWAYPYMKRKEGYFVTAINNLLKKNNFLQLSLEFSGRDDEDSDSEFEKEITENPGQYIIELKPLHEPDDITIISDIVKTLGHDFSVNEVSELFSVDRDSLLNSANIILK